MRPLPRRLLSLAGQLFLVLLLLLAAERFLTRDAARGPAPPLAASLLDGRAFDLAAWRGRPTLVYFWAPWCPSCAAMRGTVDGLARAGQPLVTVAMQSGGAATLRAYLGENSLDWAVIDDADGALSRAWGARAIPAVFVLDGAGDIRFVTRGYTTAWGLRARLWLAGLG
jgi:thiol-disulfide isomerase/thioredoxin